MYKINENKLAKEVALREGLKKELSIAQIKEVIKITLDTLAYYHTSLEILHLIKKHEGKTW